MRHDTSLVVALVVGLGFTMAAAPARAAWVDQGTTTSVVVVPDDAVADTRTETYTVDVASTTIEIRQSVVTGSWSSVPVSPTIATQARSGKMSVYQSSLGQGSQRASVDASRAREAMGATRVLPSSAKSREGGSGSTIR